MYYEAPNDLHQNGRTTHIDFSYNANSYSNPKARLTRDTKPMSSSLRSHYKDPYYITTLDGQLFISHG